MHKHTAPGKRRTLRGIAGRWRDRIRASLWAWPSVLVVAAALLAQGALAVEQLPVADHLDLLHVGAAGARATLSAIATSVMTVAGVSFTVTMVVVQLASTQFSPRVIRSFVRSRIIQVVLGLYLATFTYVILVLGRVVGSGQDRDAFVPGFAVEVAVALAIVCLFALIVFIDHVAHAIQVPSIIEAVADETRAAVDVLYPEPLGPAAPDEPPDVSGGPDGDAVAVRAKESGYLEAVDDRALDAVRCVSFVRIEIAVGEFAREGDVIARVWPQDASTAVDDAACADVEAALSLVPERTIRQDAGFGLRLIADVALRALSPGYNDPTTAVYCVNTLSDLLCTLAVRAFPDPLRVRPRTSLRIFAPRAGFRDLLRVSFRQIIHYGRADVEVLNAVARALVAVAGRAPGAHTAALSEAAVAVLTAAGLHLEHETDRARLEKQLAPIALRSS